MTKYVLSFVLLISLVLSACASAQGAIATQISLPEASQTNTLTATMQPSSTATPIPTLQLPVTAGTALPEPSEVITSKNANEIREVAHWGEGDFVKLAWSPDNNFLALATTEGVDLYETDSFQKVDFLRTDTGITSISFSPDSHTLAIGLGFPKHTIRIWNLEDRTFEDLETEGIVFDVSFSPDGKQLAYGADKQVVIRDANTHEVIRVLLGHQDNLQTVSFSSDGVYLASYAWDRTIMFWDVASGENVQSIASGGEFGTYIFDAFFSLTGPLIVFSDEVVRLWDLGTKKTTQILHSNGLPQSATLSPDGKILAAGFWNGLIKAWNTETGALLYSIQAFGDNEDSLAMINSLAISPDNHFVASFAAGFYGPPIGGIKIWDLSTGELAHTIETEGITSMAFSQIEGNLALGTSNNSIDIWDISLMSKIQSLASDHGIVKGIAFSPNGQLLLAQYDDKTLGMWNLETEQEIYLNKNVCSLGVFSPDGTVFASVICDAWEIELRSVEDNHVLKRISNSAPPVLFSPNGQLLAYPWANNNLKISDLANDHVTYLKGLQGAVSGLAFSPNGLLLASGSSDTMVKLWDVNAGVELKTLGNHGDLVLTVAFSPDGGLLASGSGTFTYVDNQVKIWDMTTGENLLSFNLQGQIFTVAFSPDGKFLAILTSSGTLGLWAVP